MTFQTERTILRAYEPADADKILELWNSLEIQDLAFVDYAAPRTKNGEFIGEFSLTMPQRKNRIGDIGISLVEAYRGQGYGREILTWVIQHGFKNCGLHRIALGTVEHNTVARALYKSMGFVEENMEREANWVSGQWRGMVRFGILEHEWDIERGRKHE
ncbi:acyl-CoA N-acyltransferase [Peniophora sp. CONT]|nr:acyl-CoA N-acyltransferase [Peniophora sp. CONT]